jgi:hypothetical protein
MLIHNIKIERGLRYLHNLRWNQDVDVLDEEWYDIYRNQIIKFDEIIRNNLGRGSIILIAGTKNYSLEWESVTFVSSHYCYVNLIKELSKAEVDFEAVF